MDSSEWDYECPTFMDFTNPTTFDTDPKEVDEYFGRHALESAKKIVPKLIRSPGKRTLKPKTYPISPKLRTITRTRLRNVGMTRAQKEEKLAQEIRKHGFKANPINRKLFEPPKNVIRAPLKHTTKPVGFNFETDKRIEIRKNKIHGSMDSVVSGQSNGQEKKPAVMNQLKLKKSNELAKENKKPYEFKLFSFMERDKGWFEKKQEKIKMMQQQESNQVIKFKARPLPATYAATKFVFKHNLNANPVNGETDAKRDEMIVNDIHMETAM